MNYYEDGRPEQRLEFITAKTFETGLIQLYYKREKGIHIIT